MQFSTVIKDFRCLHTASHSAHQWRSPERRISAQYIYDPLSNGERVFPISSVYRRRCR